MVRLSDEHRLGQRQLLLGHAEVGFHSPNAIEGADEEGVAAGMLASLQRSDRTSALRTKCRFDWSRRADRRP